ncbi:MAG TPA: hypothetical protein VE974_23165 [Thermoanaerobaculia bacterium]|nr:hypothetical protein [Thermoanaerobaculia bacterium]
MSLAAAIEIRGGQTVELRITNISDRTIAILNPDLGVPSPAVGWPYSLEVYRTFLLMSFAFLSISMTDDSGDELRPRRIDFSVTPALRTPIDLEPGGWFTLPIPIGDFYELRPGQTYDVAIEYGDRKQRVRAETRLTFPARG